MSIIMIVLAIFLGIVTVMITRSLIQNQRRTSVTSQVKKDINLVSVVVAVVPMKFGDEILAEKLKVISWPADIKPEGSFESIASIIGDQRRVVLRSIGRNEPVSKEKISGFGSRATLSQVINKEHRAVTIRVNDVLSVGGFVLPGDHVDIIHTFQNGKERMDTQATLIIRDVRVLAIDQISDENQEGALVGKAATLEVTTEQAQKIALSTSIGSLSLALRRMNIDDPETDKKTKVLKVSDLKPATITEEIKPKPISTGTRRRVYRAKPVIKKNPYGDMKITRGTQASTEKVLIEEIANTPAKAVNTLAGTTND